MPFHLVSPDDPAQVAALVRIRNASAAVDDPAEPPTSDALEAGWLRYGWDLELSEQHLYVPEGGEEPVGILHLTFPTHDNLHAASVGVAVEPAHRRRGHGSVIMTEALDRVRAAGRSTVWVGSVKHDPAALALTAKFGFRYASHDARRKQVLADVDRAELARLDEQAQQAAADYELVRLLAPTPDDVLESLVEVTAAINDAPMGTLTWEEEVFDTERLRNLETAAAGRGDTLYRIFARHRSTGEVGGHTFVLVNPLQPTRGGQGDTAVARGHRGHRLGLRLKIAMMHWLADVEPQLRDIVTWNNADNDFMISVNEKIGYRLDQTFAMYELETTAG